MLCGKTDIPVSGGVVLTNLAPDFADDASLLASELEVSVLALEILHEESSTWF